MNNLIVNKIPFKVDNKEIDFNVFLEKMFEYLEDFRDLQMVKEEMKKGDKGVDYNAVRKRSNIFDNKDFFRGLEKNPIKFNISSPLLFQKKIRNEWK